MNYIEAAIDKCCQGFGDEPRKVRKECVDLVIQYLFRAVNYKKLKKELQKRVESIKVSHLLEYVTNKGYITKCIKLWLVACASRGTSGQTANPRLRQEYKIEEADRNLGSMLSDKTWRLLQRLSAKYPVMTLQQIDRVLVDIQMQINVWMRKFLNKKILFIMRSQHIKLTEMQSDLFSKGCRGMFLMIPYFKSPLHAQNIVKRTVRNQGLNLIQSYTTQKRSRIVRSEDKKSFHSNTISIDAFAPAEREAAMVNMVQEMRHSDLSLDIRTFYETLESKRQKEFVGLLMGMENKRFSEYLEHKRLLRRYDELPTEKFIEVCFDYLGVPKEKGWKFVNKMQQHFGSYDMAEGPKYRGPERRTHQA